MNYIQHIENGKIKTKKKRITKVESSYRSMYISDGMIDKITKISWEYDTSFNNVVICMLRSCLDEDTPIDTPPPHPL